MLFDNDDNHYSSLMKRKLNADKDTHKNIPLLSRGSTVAVQHEEGGLWTDRMIVGHSMDDCNGSSYIIWVTEMACVITRMKRNIKTTPVIAEDYLKKDVYYIMSHRQLIDATNLLISLQPMGLKTEVNSHDVINLTNKPVTMPQVTGEEPVKDDRCQRHSTNKQDR